MQFRFTRLKMPNYGLCIIEDFVPISGERALVAAGRGYRELNFILNVAYRFTDKLELSDPQILQTGTYLRLGHLHEGELIYSEGWEGVCQPFKHNGNSYHTADAPNGRLYRDGKILIDHWPGIAELGNAWVDEFIWFEARDETIPAPFGWSLYRADLNGENIQRLFVGANPCMFNGTLYYGIWNGDGFDIATADRRDCLPADAHLPVGRVETDRRPGEAAASH